jgi:hypothetical protein
MFWDQPPVAVCRSCGGFLSSHNAHLISQPCRRSHNGAACGGHFEATLTAGIWHRCSCLDGCSNCHNSGWVPQHHGAGVSGR